MFQISYLGVGNGLLISYFALCCAGENETNWGVLLTLDRPCLCGGCDGYIYIFFR